MSIVLSFYCTIHSTEIVYRYRRQPVTTDILTLLRIVKELCLHLPVAKRN